MKENAIQKLDLDRSIRTTIKRTLLLSALLTTGASVIELHAQQPPVKSPTNAELRARTETLEQELTRLQRDYKTLLTTCSAPSSGESSNALPLNCIEREATARVPEPSQPTGPDYSWFIRSTDYGVTETNRVYSRYSWAVTINNGGSERPRVFDVTMEFLDSNNLIIDTDHSGRISGSATSRFSRRV